jgi:hypothetical protein
MADASVDGGQPVDVEHEEGQRLASSARAGDLALEEGMKRPPVVELGQRIELGNRIGVP